MKTLLLLLALASSASAMPLSPALNAAIGAGVSAASQRPVPSTPQLNLSAPSLRPTIAVPVAPRPICVLPVPARPARPATIPSVSR